MKTVCTVLALVFFCSCKTISTEVHSTDKDEIIMKSTEKWTFYDPEEKLKIVVSPENGGQIASLSWEGKKVADTFSDSYPNKEKEIKLLKPRVLFDDSDSDLILIYSTARGDFQLLRSYKLMYDSSTKEHYIEVIYNVKNYSSNTAIDQQWIHNLSLSGAMDIKVSGREIRAQSDSLSLKISTVDVYDIELANEKGAVKIGNRKSFKLGFKEKLSWKVKYSLKSID